jgi:cell division septal protein FtsQ
MVSLFQKNNRIKRTTRTPQRPQARLKVDKKKKRIPRSIFRRRFDKVFSLIGIGFALVFFVICILGAVLFFTLFTVQNIELSRKDIRLDGTQAARVLANTYAGKNIFFIREKQMTSLLERYFPEIKDIQLEKKYPSVIRVTISTYPVTVRWSCERVQKEFTEEGDILQKTIPETYFLNEKGIITKADQDEQHAFVIYEKAECPPIIKRRDILLRPEIIKTISVHKPELEEILGVPITRAGYYRDAREIHFYTQEETAIWIDFATPADEQIQKLRDAIVLEPGLKKPMNHIDLRVKEKIFYAPK